MENEELEYEYKDSAIDAPDERDFIYEEVV
jgi:hypothetical protein